jgi:D-beta-D-heptose 7-phosphate kinase/D-beta-D-heptose 1-phosphate adenosyltransferase
LSLEELLKTTKLARNRGEVIVMTNGCFDILHAGHVHYLNEARKLGDRLIVAVNTDDSVKRLKGPDRPINSTHNRMLVLDALGCVDWVVAFDEDTPNTIIDAIVPDKLVKGGDYIIEEIVGFNTVTKAGGEVIVIDLTPGCSTTNIINKVRDN